MTLPYCIHVNYMNNIAAPLSCSAVPLYTAVVNNSMSLLTNCDPRQSAGDFIHAQTPCERDIVVHMSVFNIYLLP